MSLLELGKQLIQSSKSGNVEDVKILMSNGAPFTTDWLGISPLHFASEFGHLETAEVLLRSGISRDIRSKVDRTPLHVASQFGHVDIVALLLSYGADIESKDMLKMTPLHWAIEKNRTGCVQLLLEQNANTEWRNKFDLNAMDIAIFKDQATIIHLLKSIVPRAPMFQKPMQNQEDLDECSADFYEPFGKDETLENIANRRIKVEPEHIVLDEYGHILEPDSVEGLQIIEESALTIVDENGEPIINNDDTIEVSNDYDIINADIINGNYIIEEIAMDSDMDIKPHPSTLYASGLIFTPHLTTPHSLHVHSNT